jgi:hypothetical protein
MAGDLDRAAFNTITFLIRLTCARGGRIFIPNHPDSTPVGSFGLSSNGYRLPKIILRANIRVPRATLYVSGRELCGLA